MGEGPVDEAGRRTRSEPGITPNSFEAIQKPFAARKIDVNQGRAPNEKPTKSPRR